jgi:hypothetical protein
MLLPSEPAYIATLTSTDSKSVFENTPYIQPQI